MKNVILTALVLFFLFAPLAHPSDTITELPGWPVKFEAWHVSQSIVVSDINGDGKVNISDPHNDISHSATKIVANQMLTLLYTFPTDLLVAPLF